MISGCRLHRVFVLAAQQSLGTRTRVGMSLDLSCQSRTCHRLGPGVALRSVATSSEGLGIRLYGSCFSSYYFITLHYVAHLTPVIEFLRTWPQLFE